MEISECAVAKSYSMEALGGARMDEFMYVCMYVLTYLHIYLFKLINKYID